MVHFIFFGIFSLLISLHFQDKRFRSLSIGLFFILITVYAGIRVGSGRDYSLYEHAYKYPTGLYGKQFEPIWRFINQSMLDLGLQFRTWLFLTAGSTFLIMIAGFQRMSKNVILSLICFVLIYQGYFESMNAVRQYVAIAISFCAFYQIIQKRYWLFILMVLLAAQFHSSAYFALIILPLALVKLEEKTLLISLGATLIFGSFLLGTILDIATPLLPERYGYYIKTIYATTSTSGLFKFFVNFAAAMLIVIGKPLSKQHKEIGYYVHLFTFAICIYNLTIDFEVAMRLMWYPFVFIFVLLPNIYELSQERQAKAVLLLIVIGFTTFMLKNVSDPMEPYALYKTIFTPMY